MQNKIQEVAHILENQLNIHRDLARLSDKLTDVIINGEIKELDEILKVQQTMIMTLGKLEEERMKAVAELGEKDLTITRLIDMADDELAGRLETIFEELLEVIEEQRRLNHINNKLLKTNLEYVEFTLGNLTGNKPINLFDQKA